MLSKKSLKKFVHSLLVTLKVLLRSLLDTVVLLGLAVVAMGAYVYWATPRADTLITRSVPQTTVIYDHTGEHVLYEIHGEENRMLIPHDEISDFMRFATVAAEDDGFYNHPGVDFLSILRAFRENIRSNAIEQGGSTITQQLVRNVFLTREKTLDRKFREVILALKVERHFSKEDILDLYLNEVPYGSNAYGVQSAAQTYFGKEAKDLTLDEAAFLAALPKATTYYSPYGNHVDDLIARQRHILNRLVDLGYAERSEIDGVLTINTLEKVQPFRQEIDAPHFVFYVIEQLEQKYGRDAVERGGLHVYTTLDYDLQKKAEEIVREGVKQNVRYGATNAALVAIMPQNGAVIAMVGSADYFNEAIDGEVNVALRPRQPGSAFKPIAYAKAFEKGFQPETLIQDVRTNFGPDGSGKNYIPQNYDGKHHGIVTMRQAIANSLNVPAVKTLYLAGVDATIDLAERLGIRTLTDRNRYGLSLVLGGGEVRLLELTEAFGVFANDGVRHAPNGILRITDRNGVFYERPKDDGENVLDPQVARKINSILSDNNARSMIFGTNTPLTIAGQTLAAKTGTTQEFRDAWTVGYTPSLAVGVWAGNNDNSTMRPGSDGVFVAAPLWNTFMRTALEGKKREDFIAYEKGAMPNITMLSGTLGDSATYFNKKTGKRLSDDKLSKMDPKKLAKDYRSEQHDILYYINKDDPLTSLPNFQDPMFHLWEQSLQDPESVKDN